MTAPGEPARCLAWDEIAVGQSIELPTAFDAADQAAFAALSGDRSRIHWDAAFAQAQGLAGPVVYGGLIVARLSCLLGMHLPGDLGLAASWQVEFHNPLHIGEQAVLRAEVAHKSDATRLLELKAALRRDGRLIARARLQSRVLDAPGP